MLENDICANAAVTCPSHPVSFPPLIIEATLSFTRHNQVQVMAPFKYSRIVLNERPVTEITPDTFRTESHLFSSLKPSDGQVLIQVIWISLDPAMRGWLRDTRSYVPPVQIGEVMRAQGLGTVIEVGGGSEFRVGDLVKSTCGEWIGVGYVEQALMCIDMI